MYEVIAGDTIWKLSQSFNSSVPLIKTANGLTSNTISCGAKVKDYSHKADDEWTVCLNDKGAI